MIYVLIGLIVLLFGGTVLLLALILDSHERQQAKVIAFSEETVNRLAVQLEESRAQVSEMATRIQHPQIMRPDLIEREDIPTPPTYDDEYDLVGRVVEEPEMSTGG